MRVKERHGGQTRHAPLDGRQKRRQQHAGRPFAAHASPAGQHESARAARCVATKPTSLHRRAQGVRRFREQPDFEFPRQLEGRRHSPSPRGSPHAIRKKSKQQRPTARSTDRPRGCGRVAAAPAERLTQRIAGSHKPAPRARRADRELWSPARREMRARTDRVHEIGQRTQARARYARRRHSHARMKHRRAAVDP